jgi:hypothetical protein
MTGPMNLRAAVIAIPMLWSAPVRADVPVLTRTTPLTPTGELVQPGHLEHTQDVVAFEHEFAIAPNDRVELRLTTPVVPAPILGGDLQLRVSVLPRASRFRLVVGTNVAVSWINGGDLWLGGSVTAAYRSDRWSVHATERALAYQFETGDQLYLSTAGVTLSVGKTGVLFAEVGEVAWRHPTCAGTDVAARTTAPDPPPPSCMAVDAGRGFAIGARFGLHDDMAIGVSAIIFRVGDTTVPLLPLVSISWDH